MRPHAIRRLLPAALVLAAGCGARNPDREVLVKVELRTEGRTLGAPRPAGRGGAFFLPDPRLLEAQAAGLLQEQGVEALAWSSLPVFQQTRAGSRLQILEGRQDPGAPEGRPETRRCLLLRAEAVHGGGTGASSDPPRGPGGATPEAPGSGALLALEGRLIDLGAPALLWQARREHRTLERPGSRLEVRARFLGLARELLKSFPGAADASPGPASKAAR